MLAPACTTLESDPIPPPAVTRPNSPAHPVVVFDGLCNLCNGSVRFVIAHDPSARFRFAAAQSAAGEAMLREIGATVPARSAVVLVEGDRWYTGSTAALRIARALAWPWPLLYTLVVVPRPLRDALYHWVGRNRYAWFGRSPACPVPNPRLRGRFL